MKEKKKKEEEKHEIKGITHFILEEYVFHIIITSAFSVI